MFRFIILLITTLCLPVLASDWMQDLDDPADVPYQSGGQQMGRLEMVAAVSERFGADQLCGDKNRRSDLVAQYPEAVSAGIFGGIYLNTFRQWETRRDGYAIWSIPNASLNVQVFGYMEDYLAGRSCLASEFIEKFGEEPQRWGFENIDRFDVCESWHDFFRAHDQGSNDLMSLLWRAHSFSLFHVWVAERERLEEALTTKEVPKKEWRYWNSWNRIVAMFPTKFDTNSCAYSMYPMVDVVMPHCLFGTNANGRQCKGEAISDSFRDRFSAITVRHLLRVHLSTNLNLAILALLPDIDN